MERSEAVAAGGGAGYGIAELARRVVVEGTARGFTVAVAESLTGGLLAAAITSVPGASVVFRGSVTAYATEIKASVLGVDAALLAREGAVHPEVARQMADGVRRLFGATVGLATTGVAGPTEQDGKPVGLVYVGYSDGGYFGVGNSDGGYPGVGNSGVGYPEAGSSEPETAPIAEELHLSGDREAIRAQTVARALELVFKRDRRL